MELARTCITGSGLILLGCLAVLGQEAPPYFAIEDLTVTTSGVFRHELAAPQALDLDASSIPP